MPENTTDKETGLPMLVTFRTGAALLEELGIVTSMTREGVRLIARDDPDWPFGPGRAHQYVKIGLATCMATEPFLDFFHIRGKKGRGPARKPAEGPTQDG